MNTKIVYQLDEDGFLVGTTTADESPEDQDVFLIPRLCVEIEPPPHVEGKRQQFIGGAFEYVDVPSPEYKPTLTIAEITGIQWEKIKQLRELRAAGGFKAGGKWFHSDLGSRVKQLGLVLLGSNIPANTQWKTMDGSFVVMTQTLAGQIFQSAAVSDMATFAKAEQHKAAMEASVDPATYDFSANWPLIYGE